MAARILRFVRAGSSAAWPRTAAAAQPRFFMPIAPSRAFSANAAATASQAEGIDVSSTVAEMRNFALMHGISLKGLRLKADMLAAIQMHFGVFAKVHAGAHLAGLQLQEESAAAPMEHETADEHLKALDHVIARQSSPSPALVALRRILSSTKLSDVRAFPETSSLPHCVMVVVGSSRQMQVIASRVKKAIALHDKAADIGSDGRRSELWACVVCPDLVLHVFSPDGARIYMDDLMRVRESSIALRSGPWSPKNVDGSSK